MRIGIYGGTFDPPHLGHMEAAKVAMTQLQLDKLLLIPTNKPPHKFLDPGSASAVERLAMAELLADGIGRGAEALDIEVRREGPSYSVDTITSLRELYPEGEFYLLMGSDMFFSFQSWKQAKDIAKEVTLVPFSRGEEGPKELFAVQQENLQQTLQAKISHLSLSEIHAVSSTQIRGLLRKTERQDEGGALLWHAVYGYILRQGLYGVKVAMKNLSLRRLRAVSYSMMRAKRIAHVQGVEETAAALAERWGANQKEARRAAILHDCTKYYSLEEQLAVCDTYQIALNELERGSSKLLHAKTAAALANAVFGESQEVCEAIDCHTTGKAGMGLLDQIIYVADYIEPTRNFDGVELLRKQAEENLTKALLLGLETTMEELKEKGAVVHSDTQGAIVELRRLF